MAYYEKIVGLITHNTEHVPDINIRDIFLGDLNET
jgi:hypothetical protein